MIARLFASPALHFVVLGALLFAGRAMIAPATGVARVPLTPDDVARLGDPHAVEEEMLAREALALGLDRRDGAVRERLRRLGAFVGEDPRNEAALEDEALRLGLERQDLVVRRHLAEMMRLAAGRLGPADLPSEDDLRDYLARHGEEFAVPARVRLVQVYLARDRHAALDADAARLLDALRGDASPDRAAERGDAFIAGADIGPASVDELDRTFGAGFGAAIADAPVASWFGPVRSSYGLHLVWVRDRAPAHVPPLDAVRARVVHRVLDERSAIRARERIDALRTRYAPPAAS
jgi:peptidyl-prolyl cis-trans isomerase C